jgi:hypothetical protein
MFFDPYYAYIDPLIIWSYRITGHPFIDFLIGTFFLGLCAVAIGEFTISLAFLANRKTIEKNTDDVVHYQNLSVDALEARNKGAYKAANKLGNDAFGKTFFAQIALSTAFLWPAPFALGWMQYRFSEVEFRVIFTDHMVGYPFVFFPLYVAAYLVFKRFKYKLPYFRRIKEILDSTQNRYRKMRSFSELLPTKRENSERLAKT